MNIKYVICHKYTCGINESYPIRYLSGAGAWLTHKKHAVIMEEDAAKYKVDEWNRIESELLRTKGFNDSYEYFIVPTYVL